MSLNGSPVWEGMGKSAGKPLGSDGLPDASSNHENGYDGDCTIRELPSTAPLLLRKIAVRILVRERGHMSLVPRVELTGDLTSPAHLISPPGQCFWCSLLILRRLPNTTLSSVGGGHVVVVAAGVEDFR